MAIKKQQQLMPKNGLWFLTLIISFIAPLSNIMFAEIIKLVIDAGAARDLVKVYYYLIISIGIIIVFVIVKYISKWLIIVYAHQTMKKYRQQFLAKILRADYQTFAQYNVTDYQHLLLNEFNQITTDYLAGFFQIIQNVLLIIYSLLAMFIGNWLLASLILITVLIPMLLSQLLNKRSDQVRRSLLKKEKQYTYFIQEILQGFLTIKNYQMEALLQKTHQNHLKSYTQQQQKSEQQQKLMATISELSSLLVFLVAFGGGMILVAHHYTTIGSVTAIVQLVNFVVLPIQELGNLFPNFKSAQNTKQELQKILNTTEKNPIILANKKPRLQHALQVENVSFSYSSSAASSLQQVHTIFQKQGKYAILGPSGSGKSTLLKLLLNLYTPTQGQILVDQTPLNQINPAWWQKQVAWVAQDVFIFDNTVLYNITLGRDIAQEQLHQALQNSGLLKNNGELVLELETQCGQHGSQLSGGQKQRIAIARALVAGKSIILLDEATSALDESTSNLIEQQLLAQTKITIVTITHKMSASILSLYDEVLYLKEGHLVFTGSFVDLQKQLGLMRN